jgi:RNA polymerase sigma factor (sigma-70 family)
MSVTQIAASSLAIPLIVRPAPRVEDHIALVRCIVAKFLRPGVDIDGSDEYADGLIGLWQATQNYEYHFGTFSNYAYQCIANKIIDGLRRRKKQEKLEECSLDDLRVSSSQYEDENEKVDFDVAELSNESHDWVIKLLEDHPEDTEANRRNKKILLKHFIQGISLTDIAEEMGCTKSYICACKKAGLNLLRERSENVDRSK